MPPIEKTRMVEEEYSVCPVCGEEIYSWCQSGPKDAYTEEQYFPCGCRVDLREMADAARTD